MEDNSRSKNGILAISALFGVLGAAVARFAFTYSLFGSILIGLVVAVIVGIVLWMNWRNNKVETPLRKSAAPATADVAPERVETKEVSAPPIKAPAADIAPVVKPVVTTAAVKPAVAKSAAKPATKPAALKTPSKSVAAKAKVKPATTKPAAVKAVAKSRPKPAVLDKPRDGGPDDLKLIKGVGPVLEKALHTSGVFHFDQVAAWTLHDAKWFDENVKGANGRVVRDMWIKQARVLAKGTTTALPNKVKKGGVS